MHDFKNTLTVVLANADLLAAAMASAKVDPAWREMTADILIAARGGLEATQRLLFFTQRGAGQGNHEDVAVGSLVTDVMALVRRPLEQMQVRVTLDLRAPGSVRGNRYELHHAVLNLVINARDAMPGGGQLTVAATARTRAEALASSLPQAGEYVEIVVTDTGAGMDAETLARIFEPFFTTRSAGTGLGLSSVFGIVQNHGGNVTAESAPGKGARFRLLLPR